MKKLIVLLLMLLPIGAFSQEQKIAFVDYNEVFEMMPELAEATTQYETVAASYNELYTSLQTEYQAKYEEFMKNQDTLPENLKVMKQEQIQDIYERIQNFIPQAQQELEQEQAKLMAPIQEKLMNAIKDIAEEQGYTYTITSQVMFHTGKNAIDATPLVKAKLGIK